MPKSQANSKKTSNEKSLTIPDNAGRAVVESEAVLACRLLGTDAFVRFCSKRGLKINRERLIRLERLGLFAPVFRVLTPNDDEELFEIPVREGNNWFQKGWAYETTCVPQKHDVPDHTDSTQEGYYSVFQVYELHWTLSALTLQVQLDGFLDGEDGKPIDWQKKGMRWMEYTEQTASSLREHQYRRAIALLCQHISNRYYPQTQGDMRTRRTSRGHSSDHWVSVNALNWDWETEACRWDPKKTEKLYGLTSKKLRHAYETLASELSRCDPIEPWYQLTQFISLRERERLKDDALRAETLRAGAHMLRLLYKDLYKDELPHPNEVTRTIINHFPELEVRRDTRRYLEFVTNRFGINPQPRLSLIVEGESEEVAVMQIFEEYYGIHPGIFGIEITVLGGVDVATGNKEDRFRAILRLIDYLHHHQTFTFLVLDNENYATKLKKEAEKAKSIHSDRRHVTRPEYIQIWKDSFEFDNFSCTEIANALNELALGHATFTTKEVLDVKKQYNSGSGLKKLYRNKANYDLQKLKLSEILVRNMISPNAKRKIENRSIIKTLNRVKRLAARNPLPVTQEIWEANQASKYFGKKRKPQILKKGKPKAP